MTTLSKENTMPVDINGKGILIGTTVTVSATVTAVLPYSVNGQQAQIKLPSGATRFTNIPKDNQASYAVASTPSLTGVVVGFTNSGQNCTFKETDGNLINEVCSKVTAT
jgi:hypothetical protein